MSDETAGITVSLPVSGRIDSNNAASVEAGIRAACDGKDAGRLILDAANLEYISSAGLRVLLRLKKELPELVIVNVCSEVYEILEMTGFTEMLSVHRAYRSLSLDGCEQIGRGANGKVYRYDGDNVVKVYNSDQPLEDIRHEREMAKLALITGIPTAISYDVVKVGEHYGAVFELLDARSFSSILAESPDKLDWCAREFAALMNKLHSTEAPAGKLPEMKDTVLVWAEQAGAFLPDETWKKLLKLVSDVPEGTHLLHGDYHPKNLMLQQNEVLLIDMDTLSVGDPVFELGPIYCALIGFYELDEEAIKVFQGFDLATGRRFFEKSLEYYLGTSCPHKLREVTDKARITAYARLVSRSARHRGLDTEKSKREAAHWAEELTALVEGADDLTFRKNELSIPAERENLDEVICFIRERTDCLDAAEKTRMQLDLAVEEIFVNIADYAYAPGKGMAVITVETDEDARTATVTFADSGMPFDPLAKPDPDVTLSAGERALGGLGVFLAKKLTDEIHYEYRDGRNLLSVTKRM